MSVCRRSPAGSVCRGGCVVGERATRESLLEVVELGEVEPNLSSARAGARDPTRAGFQKLFISKFEGLPRPDFLPGHVEA